MNLRMISRRWRDLAQHGRAARLGLFFKRRGVQSPLMAGAGYLETACVSLNRYPSPSPRLGLPMAGSGKFTRAGPEKAKLRGTCRPTLKPALIPLYWCHKRQRCGGSKKCKSGNWESDWSLQHSWRGALTTIWSAVRQVRQAVRSLRAQPAEALWVVPSLAGRRAFSATTLTFVANPLTPAGKFRESTTVCMPMRAVEPVGHMPFGAKPCGASQDHLHGKEICSRKS